MTILKQPLICALALIVTLTQLAHANEEDVITLSLNSDKTINTHETYSRSERFLPPNAARLPNGAVVPLLSQRYETEDGMRFTIFTPEARHELLEKRKIKHNRTRYPNLPKDIMGNIAGGKIPVINYRRDLIHELGACNEMPEKWKTTLDRDPLVGTWAFRISDDVSHCNLQAALDVAVAAVRFHPHLHHLSEMRSSAFANELFRYEDAGIIRNAFPILLEADEDITQDVFYNLEEAPLFMVVSAYPNMRVHEYREYDTLSQPPPILDIPEVQFTFYVVSPSGYVCHMESSIGGYAGLACIDMLDYIPTVVVTVRYNYDRKRWQLWYLSSASIWAGAAARDNHEENRDVGQAYTSGLYNALAYYYPPIREWFKAIESRTRYELQRRDFTYPINTYAFAPGYGIAAMNPLSATYVDLSKPISLPSSLMRRFYEESAGVSETIALLTLVTDGSGQLVRQRDIRYMPNMSVIVTTTRKFKDRETLMDVFKYTTAQDAMLFQEQYGDGEQAVKMASLYDYRDNKIYDLMLSADSKRAVSCVLREVRPYMFQPLTLFESYYVPSRLFLVAGHEIKDGNLIVYEIDVPKINNEIAERTYQVWDGLKSRQIFRQDILQLGGRYVSTRYLRRSIQVLDNQDITDVLSLCRRPSAELEGIVKRYAEISGMSPEDMLILEWSRKSNQTVLFTRRNLRQVESSIRKAVQDSQKYALVKAQEGRPSKLNHFEIADKEAGRSISVQIRGHNLVMPDGTLAAGTLIFFQES